MMLGFYFFSVFFTVNCPYGELCPTAKNPRARIEPEKTQSVLYHLNPHDLAHSQATLNNSILPLERTPCLLGVTFNPHFTQALPRINILKTLTCTYQLGSAKGNHTYHLYVPYPVPFHV